MPTINKRFLLLSLLAFFALAGVLAAAHTVQAGRIPDALMAQSERAYEKGKLDASISYLRQYVEFRPDDTDALVKLTDRLTERPVQSRNFTELTFLYDRILRQDPARSAVRREALKVALMIARHSDAATHAQALLKDNPTEAELWRQLAAAQTGLNELAAARTSYETAVTHAPAEIVGYQRLAQFVWKNQNDTPGAKAVLDRMVDALPLHPDSHLVRGRFEMYTADQPGPTGTPLGSADRALADFRRVLELDPENPDASLHTAEILQKGRDVGAAHAILREAVGLYPRDLRLVRALAWMEVVRGNVPASIAVLEDGLKANPNGLDLLVPLADLLIQQGDAARTDELVKRLEARKAPATQLAYLKARVAMRQAKWVDAIALLERLRADAVKLPGLEAQANLLLAMCYGRTADSVAEERCFKRVADADPANVTARVGLANLYQNQGRSDDAVREFDAATASPFAPGTVAAQLIRLRTRMLVVRNAGPEEWRRVEQLVPLAAKRFGPVSSEPAVLAAEIACAQGRRAEAVSLLRKETARRPGDSRLWAVLAETTADLSGTAAGLSVLDEAQAAAGDNADVRIARATLYARDPARLRPIDPLAKNTETWPELDQLRLLYGLADVYDRIGDREKVLRTLAQIGARRPGDAAVSARLMELAAEVGNAAALDHARAALVKLEGENGPSVLVADVLRASPADLPRAADNLAAALGAAPDRADACLALARARDSAEAVKLIERAMTLEPARFEPVRAYLVHLARTDREKLAGFVARVSANPRWVGEPFRRLMRGAAEVAGPELGRPILDACRPVAEREPGGLGWLAGCLPESDRPAVLAAATQSPVANADDWLRLALVSPDAVTAAAAKLPKPAFFAVAAAFAETPTGKDFAPQLDTPDDRRGYTQARLALKLSRLVPAEAAGVLDKFLATDNLPAADAAWARRNLAMILVLSGEAADRDRARLLIRDAGSDDGASVEELRATSGVYATLARYLEGAARHDALVRALQVLEAAYKKGKSPRDLFHLAQLHRAVGDGDRSRQASRQCLQALLNSDRGNLYYLVAAVDELTDPAELKAAETFANELRTLHPGEFKAVAAVARFECRAGRPDRALALAEGYTRAADSAAGDFFTRAARVAELLDELVRMPKVRRTPAGARMTDAAAERYAALVPTRPEAIVGAAGVLAADGRGAEAFATIDRYAAAVPVRGKALAGLAALRPGGATPRQFETVRKWLDECLAADPDSPALRLNRAEFLALQQDYAAAAAEYEKVLAKDPRSVVALNNLAWIQAADPATATRSLALIDRAIREVGVTGELLDTRGRARIALQQFGAAERDLTDALRQERTPLRLFHRALLLRGQSPPKADEALAAFREALDRGLDRKGVHPSDLPEYAALEAAAR